TVSCLLVVSRAAREVSCAWVIGAGYGAIRHAVAVVVLVAIPFAVLCDERLKLFLIQRLALFDGFGWVGEGFTHPQIHAEVEIAHHEDRRLQLIGEIERTPSELEAFGNA